MRRAALAFVVALAGSCIAEPAYAQATAIVDRTVEIRVVANDSELNVPSTTTTRQLFRVVAGEQATIRLDLKAEDQTSGLWNTLAAMASWISKDPSVVKVVGWGNDFALIEGQPGAEGLGTQLSMTYLLPGFVARKGQGFALFYQYIEGRYQCSRLVVPSFTAIEGLGVYTEAPDFPDQLAGLEGCVSLLPPPEPDPPPTVMFPNHITTSLTVWANGNSGLRITLLDAQDQPVGGEEVTVEILSGAWASGNVSSKVSTTSPDGVITPGDLKPGTEVKITTGSASDVTVKAAS